MLYFLHIPKTGGMSVHDAMLNHFRGRLLWYPRDIGPQLFDTNHHLPQDVDLIGGHFSFNQIKPRLDEKSTIFSTVRDPLDRVYSYFNHVTRRDPNHPLNAELKDLDITQAIERSEQFRFEVSNFQTWFLTGRKDSSARAEIKNGNIYKLYPLEGLPTMVTHMYEALGRSRPNGSFPHSNQAETPYFVDRSPRADQVIRSLNAEDLALYEEVMSQNQRS